MRRWLLLAALSAALAPRLGAAERLPQVGHVAITDFVVTSVGKDPRAWLGPVYSEVLARRLRLANNVLVTEPLQVRGAVSGPAPTDLAGVTKRCLDVLAALRVPNAIGGVIEDRGATINVTAVVVTAKDQRSWSLSQEVPFEQLWQPQVDLVVRRFVPNLGARLGPGEPEAMAKYDPGLSPDTLILVGQGWQAYAPEAPEDAFRLWRRALAVEPECRLASEALADAGYLYRKLLLKRALDLYTGEVAQNAKDAEAHYHLGEIYADLAQWKQAATEFDAAIAARNTFYDAYVGLAQALLEQRLYERVILVCEGARKLWPDNPKILHSEAAAMYSRGMVSEARAIWQRLLQLDPKDELARERVGLYGSSAGDR